MPKIPPYQPLIFIISSLVLSISAHADHNTSIHAKKCAQNYNAPMVESSCLKNTGVQLDMEMNQVMHRARRHLLSAQKNVGNYQVLTDLDTEHFQFLKSRKQTCHNFAKTAKPGYPQLISLQRCLINMTNKRIHALNSNYPIKL